MHPNVLHRRLRFPRSHIAAGRNGNTCLLRLMARGNRQIVSDPPVHVRFIQTGRMALAGLHRELELGHYFGDMLGGDWVGLNRKRGALLQNHQEHSGRRGHGYPGQHADDS